MIIQNFIPENLTFQVEATGQQNFLTPGTRTADE
jgi:hypothetical protein